MPLLRSCFACLCCLFAETVGAGGGVVPPNLELQRVASGFNAPVALRSAPDNARLFVVEQGGAIRIVDQGVVLEAPFLQIAGSGGTSPPLGFTGGGERGLLGLAFHPDYANNGRFFIYYTDARGDSVVARYQRSADDANLADAASGSVVLRVDQDFSNHNGGDIHFGPDDMLYVGLGDGGRGNDPCNRAQTLEIADILTGIQNGEDCNVDGGFTGDGGDPASLALLGKMLRIDVDATTPAGGDERCGFGAVGTIPYGIPNDNPYAAADGICDEVWHAGLRNPFRFSFDRDTGDLWIGDVGQSAREEIDFVAGNVGGLNFGWRCREGEIAGGNTSLCANPPPFTAPLLTYDRNVGQSITGGFRYRGPQAALTGIYFFADFITSRLFAFDPAQPGLGREDWRVLDGNPSSYGEGADGELYLVDYSGCVFRLDAETILRDGFEEPLNESGCP